jgi:hypothetical protein
MKRLISVLVLVVLFSSCQDDVNTPPPPEPVIEKVFIRDVDYIKNKYFYFADPYHFIGPRPADPQIEVYRTVTPQDLLEHPDIIRFPGWVTPDSVGDGQSIRDLAAIINSTGTAPDSLALHQDFELLTFGSDYDYIVDSTTNRTIGIHLFSAIPDHLLKALAVRYINEEDVAVGGTYQTMGVNKPGEENTLLLKMLKAPDPRTQGRLGTVWKLALRSVYNLGWTHIQPGSLKVEIMDLLNAARLATNTPAGSTVRYLRIFGLDTVGKNGSGPHDGLIDPGFVDYENGLLWMPSIHPFAPDPADVDRWTEGQFSFTGDYQAQYDKSMTIYTRLLNPVQEQDAHQYDIHVTRTTASP